MTTLVLALALAAPAAATTAHATPVGLTCSVSVAVMDAGGRERAASSVSARRSPALVLRGRTSRPSPDAPPLVFDVYTPRGQRYQALLAAPPPGRGTRALRRVPWLEARLAVAGSSIEWASMYGLWRVEPRLEGRRRPCGPAQLFTIRP
jgi:hypothetical protein